MKSHKPNKITDEENRRKNILLFRNKILSGDIFPVHHPTGYRVICNCEDMFSTIYNESRESIVESYKDKKCSICNKNYAVSEEQFLAEQMQFVFINANPISKVGMIALSDLRGQDLEILFDASKIAYENPLLQPLIDARLKRMQKEHEERIREQEDVERG